MLRMADPAMRRLIASSTASVCIHGGAAAALFLGFGSSSTAPPPAAAMVIEMAALPSAPPLPPSPMPPAPDQDEAQPKPVEKKIKLPPIPKLAMNVKPEVAVPLDKLLDEKKPQKDKPADETTRATAPDAPLKDAPKAPQQGAPSNSPSNAEQTWEGRVLAALERKKRYPGDAMRQRQEDVVYVRIAVDRKGRVVNSQIRKSRGFGALNTEVMALVQRASPLPAPPQEVSGDPVTLLVPVEFFLKNMRS